MQKICVGDVLFQSNLQQYCFVISVHKFLARVFSSDYNVIRPAGISHIQKNYHLQLDTRIWIM